MSRYIDADKLKESIDNCDICNICPDKDVRCSYDCGFPDALDYKWEKLIDAQPTIDAVEVVRCCECKWFSDLFGCTKEPDTFLVVNDDDYCSYGERKETDHE